MVHKSNPVSLNIIYFGSAGALSLAPFSALVNSAHCIKCLVVHDTVLNDSRFSVIQTDQPGSVQALALKNNIPIFRVARDFSTIIDQLKLLDADVIVTSCFDLKLTPEVLALPSIASINIHPSILPAYRGPSPLFWQLRDAVEITGVSLHLMNDKFDEGDVLAQKSIAMKGIKHFSELLRLQGQLAAKLLVSVLGNLVISMLQARPQNSALSSYQSFPEVCDYEISAEWTSQRIVEFMMRTNGMAPYYPVNLEGKSYKLLTVSEDDSTQAKIKTKTFINNGQTLCFPCSKGYICADILTE